MAFAAEQERAAGLPLVEELVSPLPPEEAFLRFASRSRCLFLDSALRDPVLGRYSYLAADPCVTLTRTVHGPDPFRELRDTLARFRSATVPDLPPFQGGLAGLWSYDLNRCFESLPAPVRDPLQIPLCAVGVYDVVLAYDHQRERAWLISQGFPETEPTRRRDRAAARLAEVKSWLASTPGTALCRPDAFRQPEMPQLTRADLEPLFPSDRLPDLWSNFSASGYQEAVARAIEYIRAGDIFQVNLAQRLIHPARLDPLSLYLRLRERNPAPFAAYFDFGPWQLLSASPERFVRVQAGQVETRPIKGTRSRAGTSEADLFRGDELRESEKDRAENVMIVDLLRNDLSRVCEPASVRVTQLCRVEKYQFVQHLVSEVQGTLRAGLGPLDLLEASFPGGSITGAPKVRAMEIIAEFEPHARGPYCGCLGYLGFDGSCDTNILIRTITSTRGWWQAQVGGGIVAASDPASEYAETWHKAEGLLRAFR